MKRFITVLSGLLVLPAFAEVAPVYYDEIVEYTDEMLNDEEIIEEEVQPVVQQKNVAQRNTINRSTAASRAISSVNTASRANTSSRAVASSPRNASSAARAAASRAAHTNTVVSRNTASRTSVKARGTHTKPVTARVGTYNNSVMAGGRGTSYSSQQVLNDSGNALYNANSARVGVGNNRRATARASSSALTSSSASPVITEEDISETTTNLTAIAELTDYCKAQYAACMDNYCNVLDDNQGRCSCSKNLKNYAKTEAALASATEQFQEAIQKIKYIGLSGDQIEALFKETEAEITMGDGSKGQDKSKIRNSLDAIKKSVVDVSSPTASAAYDATSGISLDFDGLLSANFSSSDFSIASFLGTNNSNTSSVSNQRGEQLYKTASNRCKSAVLNSCTAQGIDPNVITNSYDLEIDKQCIAYERALNDANAEIKNNISNASMVLQLGRLKLAQNRNSYDLRGCVAAIDSCMQDEYVCGADYELCLDPTGKYLANGKIVKGGTPGVAGGQYINQTPITSTTTTYSNDSANPNVVTTQTIDDWISGGMYDLYATWNYTGDDNKKMNAWSQSAKENLGDYIDTTMSNWVASYKKSTDSTTTDNMAMYLLQKIGYIDDKDKVHGMCASVMKQCQDYTFKNQNSNNKDYIADNEVVRMFLNNTLAKIKVQQDAIISSYAEGCRADVQSCLSTNGYDESNTTSTTSRTAVNACTSEIKTCMSVGGYTPKDGAKLTLRAMSDWVASMLINCSENYYLVDDGDTTQCKSCPTATVYRETGDTCSTGSASSAELDMVAGMKTVGSANSSVNCLNGTAYGVTQLGTVQMLSDGGAVTSCDCPNGYTKVSYTCTASTVGGKCSTAGEVIYYCTLPKSNS